LTVIAYKSGIIACDSAIVYNNATNWGNMMKITRNKLGILAGACGDISFLSEFLDWVNSIEDESNVKMDLFKRYSSKENEGIVIFPYYDFEKATKKERIVSYVGNSPVEIDDDYIAIGSGMDYALGAMAAGASAITACRSAVKHSTTCDGIIYHEYLRGYK
jgi:hypothetical protein